MQLIRRHTTPGTIIQCDEWKVGGYRRPQPATRARDELHANAVRSQNRKVKATAVTGRNYEHRTVNLLIAHLNNCRTALWIAGTTSSPHRPSKGLGLAPSRT